MIAFLLWALYRLIDAYILVIVVWCIMSWFPNARNSRLGEVIDRLVEPYMHWFDFIPAIGGISFSPMIAILVLYFAQAGLMQLSAIL